MEGYGALARSWHSRIRPAGSAGEGGPMTKQYGMVLALVGVGAMIPSGDARACGGCFAPPGSDQVVTDHRMVLALSETQTVLWDQLRYAGNPADFSWILPLRDGAGAHIELGEDLFVTVMDNLTAPYLITPQGPTQPYCGSGNEEDFAGAATSPSVAADAGVTIVQQSVVGPYQTVTLHGTDPMALRNWLAGNGYDVPAATQPVIDYYVGLQMDFIALRLRPGEGISAMQPVRITTPGYNPTLPLRMIAAGTADKVGLLLMVVAGSRMEAQNFPNGEVSSSEFTYDFNHPTNALTDLQAAFTAHFTAAGGRIWMTESAQNLDPELVQGPLQARGIGTSDAALAFSTAGPNAVVTRLRADLPLGSLNADLTLAASDGALLDRAYTYGHVLNTPPPYPPCGGSSSFIAACSVVHPGAHVRDGGFLVLALGAVVTGIRRLRRQG